MEKQKLYNNAPFFIVFLLTISVLILPNVFHATLFFILGLLLWGVIFFLSKRKGGSLEFSVLKLLVLSIPLSFTNVLGGSYGELMLSWFNLFLLIIAITFTFKYLVKGKVYLNHLSLMSLFMMFITIIPVISVNNKIAGIKQYINSIVLYILVIIGNSFKRNISAYEKDVLKSDYISGTLITGIGVAIQIIYAQIFNVTIGWYQFFGGYRHAFGFLFSDYSFLSLYLASGAISIYFFNEENERMKLKNLIMMTILLVTSILTSARTGIVAFVAIFGLYSVIYFLSFVRKGSVKSLYIMVANTIIAIVGYILVCRTRGIARLFSGSGREELTIKAFKIFLDNPILGIGFGSDNYIGTLPHNIVFQSLAQGGIIYSIPLLLFILLLILTSMNNDNRLVPVLLTVLFGAMFIPNIFNSRFFPVIVLLVAIGDRKGNSHNIITG